MLSGGVDKQHPTVIALAEKLRVSWLTAQASNTFALVKLKKTQLNGRYQEIHQLIKIINLAFLLNTLSSPVSNTLKPIN